MKYFKKLVAIYSVKITTKNEMEYEYNVCLISVCVWLLSSYNA